MGKSHFILQLTLLPPPLARIRLMRLETAHAEKKFKVENAREIAIKAQKERVDNEIKEMRDYVTTLDEEKQFARYCKETLIIARNMKKEEVDPKIALLEEEEKRGEGDDDDDDDVDDDDDDEESDEEGGVKKDMNQENRLLHTANAIMSQNNINNELESAIMTFNLAKMKVEKDDKEAKRLMERLEAIESCEVVEDGEGGGGRKRKEGGRKRSGGWGR